MLFSLPRQQGTARRMCTAARSHAMGDVKPHAAGVKRKGCPLDGGRAERGVWLIKVPHFLAAQWQAVPLLQERETARTRAEPALVAALVPALRCARRAPGVRRCDCARHD